MWSDTPKVWGALTKTRGARRAWLGGLMLAGFIILATCVVTAPPPGQSLARTAPDLPSIPQSIGASGGYTLYLSLVQRSSGGPIIGGCPVFPSDNPWNLDISHYPVHPNSDNYIQNILNNRSDDTDRLHPDFGSGTWNGGPIGIPYTTVAATQPMVPIMFVEFGDESDPGPYPIPPDVPVEWGSDHHVLVLQSGTCKLYELYHANYIVPGWEAGSGAVFTLTSNALRPEGYTSADAAGLPILPGLVRYDEVADGAIRHAVRFTVYRTQKAYIHPATHWASSITDSNYPPMGLRLRLKASYDISGFTQQSRVILEALKKYGMIVADNGSNWYISGAPDEGWVNDDLNQLKGVPGGAFEVVDTGEIIRP